MQEINWDIISGNRNLPLLFIQKNANKLNWNILWETQPVEILVQNFPDRVNWVWLIENRNIPNSLVDLAYTCISKQPEKVDWKKVTSTRTMSNLFVERFKDWLSWSHISEDRILFSRFATLYPEKIEWFWASLFQRLTEEQMREQADKIEWSTISNNQVLSEEFIREFADKLNWRGITVKQNLSEKFLEEFEDKIEWRELPKCKYLSEEFIERHADRLDWTEITKYQSLSEEFIRQNLDRIDMAIVGFYQKLSLEFREQYGINNVPEWLYMDSDKKKEAVVSCGLYDCFGDYFVAYKGVSATDIKEDFVVGITYESHADCMPEYASFGLTVTPIKQASTDDRVIVVRVPYENVAHIFNNGEMIRCSKFKVVKSL